MVSRIGLALIAAIGFAASPALAGPAGSKSAPSPAASAPAPARAAAIEGHGTSPAPVISQDAAARARMHECAHQWSAIKKAGNAGATTWKEFSATCLVVSR